MSLLETPNLKRIWVAAAAIAGVTLFRVNNGRAWMPSGQVKHLPNGSVLVPGARPVSLGFGMLDGKPFPGVYDLDGWTSVVITPEMVGRRVAVFTAIEGKREEGGRVSADQRSYGDLVRRAGGIAGVASSPQQAQEIISSWRPPPA